MGFLSSLIGPAAKIGGSITSGLLGGITKKVSGLFDKKPKRITDQFQVAVKDAKAAGLHPLFALGAAGAGSPSFQISGQSPSGNLAKEYIRQQQNQRAGRAPTQDPTGLVQAQTALAAVELARHSISNDRAQTITIPAHQPMGQEIKKGQVDPHMTLSREQSLNVKSPMTQVRMGSQNIWVPVEEMDEFMENPLAVGALTFAYHGNSKVDWKKLFMEYSGRKPTKSWLEQAKAYSRGRVKARQDRQRKHGSVDRAKAIQNTFFGEGNEK